MKKFPKYAAVAIFMFALVLNIKFSLSDPFMFTSDIVLSQTTDDSSSDDSSSTGGDCPSCVEGMILDSVTCFGGRLEWDGQKFTCKLIMASRMTCKNQQNATCDQNKQTLCPSC